MGFVRLFLGLFAFFCFLGSLAFGAVYLKTAQAGSAPWELAAASAGNLVFAGLLLALRRRIGRADGAAAPTDYSADPRLAPPARPELVQPDHSPIPPGAQSVPYKYRCERCGTEKRLVVQFRRGSWLLSVAGFVLAGAAFGPLKALPDARLFEFAAFMLILSPIFLALRLRCLKCEPLPWAKAATRP